MNCHLFRNKKKISSAHTAADTKKATIRLLRTIVVLTQTLQSLPDDVMMTMKLFYYDDCMHFYANYFNTNIRTSNVLCYSFNEVSLQTNRYFSLSFFMN